MYYTQTFVCNTSYYFNWGLKVSLLVLHVSILSSFKQLICNCISHTAMQTLQDKMKSPDEPRRSKADGKNNNWEQENQSDTSHNKSPLISDPWKPCRRHRAVVKGQSGWKIVIIWSILMQSIYLSAAVCNLNQVCSFMLELQFGLTSIWKVIHWLESWTQ